MAFLSSYRPPASPERVQGSASKSASQIRGLQSDPAEVAAYLSLFNAGSALHGARAFRIERIGDALIFVSPLMRQGGVFNRVLGGGARAVLPPAALREIDRRYAALGCGFALELCPELLDETAAATLRASRIRRGSVGVLLRKACSQMPADSVAPATCLSLHAGARPRAALATGAAKLICADICARVFALPPPIEALIASLDHGAGWRHWLAYLDNEPVGTALSFIEGTRCWFGWAATLPTFRSRGVKGSIDDARIGFAQDSGCLVITTDTACGTQLRPDHSLRSLKRRGFEVASRRATYYRLPHAMA